MDTTPFQLKQNGCAVILHIRFIFYLIPKRAGKIRTIFSLFNEFQNHFINNFYLTNCNLTIKPLSHLQQNKLLALLQRLRVHIVSQR